MASVEVRVANSCSFQCKKCLYTKTYNFLAFSSERRIIATEQRGWETLIPLTIGAKNAMNDREDRRFDMFGRLKTFRDAHAADITDGSIAKKEFDNINAIVDKIVGARAGQHPGRDAAKAVLLDALHNDITKILRTAAAIDIDEPGFARQFHPPLPPSERPLLAAEKILEVLWVKPDDTADVKAAKDAIAAKFVAHEMAADFVTLFKGDVERLTKDGAESELLREGSVGDTKEIEVLIESGMKSARKLDAIMHNKYDGNPQVLAEWRTARHVEADPKRKKTEPPTPPPATP